MRRKQRRYREPVFSTKFTFFLILLALVAGGIAVYTIMNTYPWATSGGNGLVYEHTTNGTTDNEPENHAVPAVDADEPDETPGTDYDENDEDTGYAEETTDNDAVYDNPYEAAPGTPDFILLTEVDNSLLPWYLKLVNRYNFLDYYFVPELMPVGGGHQFDVRAGDALIRMLESAQSEGLSPIVVSSFRSVSRQTYLFNRQVQRQINAGYNAADAFEAARRIVAYPGSSEHNLGLAVDIVSYSYRYLTAAQAYTPEGIWLAANSYRYGFILRYPYYHQHITNIIFEPWHFRYVGVYAATEMFRRGLVLEEFVSERLR